MILLFFILNYGILLYIWWLSFKTKKWSNGISLQILLALLPFTFGLFMIAFFTNILSLETIKVYKYHMYIYSSINLLLLIPQWYKLAWQLLLHARSKNWNDTTKLIFIVIFAVLMVFIMVILFAVYYLWIYSIGGNKQGLLAALANYQPIQLDFANAVYFSFVTYFTLGYGDLVPQGLWMRAFVFIECLCSVLNTGIIAVYTYNFLFQNDKANLPNFEIKRKKI